MRNLCLEGSNIQLLRSVKGGFISSVLDLIEDGADVDFVDKARH